MSDLLFLPLLVAGGCGSGGKRESWSWPPQPLIWLFHVVGACLGPRIQIGEETVITVDAKAAGKGKVTCTVSTPDGAELDVDVVENHDGTFDIYYTAPEPGKYVITIRFGGEHIPNSPFHVLVRSWPEWGWRTGWGVCRVRLLVPARAPRSCPQGIRELVPMSDEWILEPEYSRLSLCNPCIL